jgi:hypothetical protein
MTGEDQGSKIWVRKIVKSLKEGIGPGGYFDPNLLSCCIGLSKVFEQKANDYNALIKKSPELSLDELMAQFDQLVPITDYDKDIIQHLSAIMVLFPTWIKYLPLRNGEIEDDDNGCYCDLNPYLIILETEAQPYIIDQAFEGREPYPYKEPVLIDLNDKNRTEFGQYSHIENQIVTPFDNLYSYACNKLSKFSISLLYTVFNSLYRTHFGRTGRNAGIGPTATDGGHGQAAVAV